MYETLCVHVLGDVVTRNGRRVYTLPEVLEKELSKALNKVDGEVIQIKQNVQFGTAAGGGSAFLTIVYKASSRKK